LYEVSFRMLHEGCPFADISKRYEATIVEWCNETTDAFEIRSKDPESLQRIVSEFKALARGLGSVKMRLTNFGEERSGLVIRDISGCMCGRVLKSRGVIPVSRTIRRNKCVDVPPTIYKAGWEYYTVLSFDASDFKDLFAALEKLGPVEVTSKKTYRGAAQGSFTVSLRGLFSELTPKQVDAYISALDGGYYAVPRKTTIGKIARTRRVARTTYDEHLRKAESKVALAIAPYLRIYEAGSYT
jgi:predicted DNA binding protein